MIRTSPLRVAIVEDQGLYRAMLGGLINSHPQVQVVAVARSYADAIATLDPTQLDLAILDVELGDGNGILLGSTLRAKNSSLGILLLSSHDVMNLVLTIPSDEVRGWSYLSKTSSLSPARLIEVMETTANGGTVLDEELIAQSTPRRGSLVAQLSPRQFETLQLVAQGHSNQSIAEQLSLSTRSIEGHLLAAYEVLGLANQHSTNPRVAAVLKFLRETSRVG